MKLSTLNSEQLGLVRAGLQALRAGHNRQVNTANVDEALKLVHRTKIATIDRLLVELSNLELPL